MRPESEFRENLEERRQGWKSWRQRVAVREEGHQDKSLEVTQRRRMSGWISDSFDSFEN
jgi:hypothetical protein